MSASNPADESHSSSSPGVSGHSSSNTLPPISPDYIEQDFSEELDNIIPTRGYQMTPMVGIGGSAGSIPALIEFFKAMPVDSDMPPRNSWSTP